ncbi:hypothetical protein SARC_18140, partial [Sphaeroforma arctica JP610]
MSVTETTDLCKKCYYESEVVDVSVEYSDLETMVAELPDTPIQVPVARASVVNQTLIREPTTAAIPSVQSRLGYRIVGAAKGKVHVKDTCGSLKNKVVEEMVGTGTTDWCKKCYTEEVVGVSVGYADIEAMLAELPDVPTQVPGSRHPTTATIPTTPTTLLPLSS